MARSAGPRTELSGWNMRRFLDRMSTGNLAACILKMLRGACFDEASREQERFGFGIARVVKLQHGIESGTIRNEVLRNRQFKKSQF